VCTENVARIDLMTESHNHPGMVALLSVFLNLLISPLKSTSRPEAENAALRQQLVVLQRKVHGRIQFERLPRRRFVDLLSKRRDKAFRESRQNRIYEYAPP
jgi:hypothetical protein